MRKILVISFVTATTILANAGTSRDDYSFGCEVLVADSSRHARFKKASRLRVVSGSSAMSIAGHLLIFGTILGWQNFPADLDLEFRSDSGDQDHVVQIISGSIVQPQPESTPQPEEPPKPETPLPARPVRVTPPVVAQPNSAPIDLSAVTASGADSNVEKSLLNLKTQTDQLITYPTLAKQYEIQGRVVAGFKLDKDGKIRAIRVIESSGYRLLDEEVTSALIEAGRVWKADDAPGGFPGAPYDVLYPVEFKLIRE